MSYRRLIADALTAVELVSASSYRWFGVAADALTPEMETRMAAADVRGYLTHNVRWRMYADFYCPGGVRPAAQDPTAESHLAHTGFVSFLSRANAGTGGREAGWTLGHVDDGSFVVARDGLSLWLNADDLCRANMSELTPGAAVVVRMPKELLRLSPGFYMALGDAEFPVDDSVALLRLYWNVRSEGAAALMAALSTRLNQSGVPFRFKVVSEPKRYTRCDAGVLYIRLSDYARVTPVVTEVHEQMAAALKPETPALTKPLAPGLGLAEDPGAALGSFGMHRCQLLAEAILRAAELGLTSTEERLDAVESRFHEDGLALEAPYLNPGSEDRYLPLAA